MYRKTELENGLRIVSEHLPHSMVVSIGVWIKAGSRDERPGNNGCAHFVEHMFFKGTRARSAQQIARELDVLGGTANAFTSRENTCFYATVRDTHLSKIFDLFSDILLNSLFDASDIEKERQVILQEINMVEDAPDDQVHDLFASLIWGSHPLGGNILGTRDSVAALSREGLCEHVAHYYTPDRVLISAAGNVEHDVLVELCKRNFAGLQPCAAPPPGRVSPKTGPVQTAVDSKPLEQVHTMVGTSGLASNAADRYKLHLLNVVLGGNMSSRLFQEIREKRGLVYSIYSDVASYSDCGYIAIYLGAEKKFINKALSLIADEIEVLAGKPVSRSEMEDAREFVKTGLYLAADNMESVMMRIARNELILKRYFTLEEVAAAFDRVSRREVQALARELFSGRDLALAAVGPVHAGDIEAVSLKI